MSRDYTLISDLNTNPYPGPSGMPGQGGQPSLPSHAQMSGGQGQMMQHHVPQAHVPQGQMQQLAPPPMAGPPMRGGMNMAMLKNYLAGNDSDSDSDDEDEYDEDVEVNVKSKSKCRCSDTWTHVYGVLILIILAVLLYFVICIRRELVGIYEE